MAGHGDAYYLCDVCSFELWLPIGRLDVSTLGLYDDARFPGRCLLVFHRHEEDLGTLSTVEAHQLMEDLRRAGRVILAVTKAPRMNYALLGNKEPHIHFHLIPRSTSDPVSHLTPWHHPEPRRDLTADRRAKLLEEIRGRLEQSLAEEDP